MYINTGDLALFSGTSETHKKVQGFIGSKWSQVSLLIEVNGQIASFESTKIPICVDMDTGELVSGVQLIWLSEKIKNFNGDIAIRMLHPPLNITQRENLYKFVKSEKGKPFNNSKYFMARAKERRNTSTDLSSFFCSQLVAEALQTIGILQKPPLGLSSGNYSPLDFFSESTLPLTDAYYYSKEVIIKT